MDVFLLKESMILDVIVALGINGKMPHSDGLWILIIGPSSSGKSELVNTLNKVPFVFPISNLTENTFLSNMKLGEGKEASLLHRIGKLGVITMKDYTSILSMNPKKRETIVGQMREIYDGRMDKLAGNGNNEHWDGKINWLGASTESVYMAEDETAGMGRRTINYIMPNQDRRETTLRSQANNHDIIAKREMIQDAFADYIISHINNLPMELPQLPDELANELVDIADFMTWARSPTTRNFKGELVLVPDPEMPMRAFSMLMTIARVLYYIHTVEGTLEEELDNIKKIIHKLAFDSIPKQRTLVLTLLAKYQRLTTKGTAQILRYPTETVRAWLENINVLGICERTGGETGDGESGPDSWTMVEKFRDIMVRYGGVEPLNTDLLATSEKSLGYNDIQPAWMANQYNKPDDPGQIKEDEERIQRRFEAF